MYLSDKTRKLELENKAKSFELPENYFPETKDIVKIFNKMSILDVTTYTFDLKYHTLEFIRVYRKNKWRRIMRVFPRVVTDYPDEFTSEIYIEDSRSKALSWNFMDGNCIRVPRTDGFEVPDYIAEFRTHRDKESDLDYEFHWSPTLLYSANYLDFRDFRGPEFRLGFVMYEDIQDRDGRILLDRDMGYRHTRQRLDCKDRMNLFVATRTPEAEQFWARAESHIVVPDTEITIPRLKIGVTLP